MAITKNAITVLERRYLARDEFNNPIETVDGMFKRVAKSVAMAEASFGDEEKVSKYEKEFYDVMVNQEFFPNSPTLMNAGRPLGQLSACFVLPVEDSMEGIFESVKQAALIHKSGGGTGFSFSRIRQKGSVVKSTGGVASGPISFMKVFNTATEAVKQGGTRRGANMGILRIDHPDIMEFINCKKENGEITNFNISVGITEAFMEAVRTSSDYDLIDPKTKKSVATLNAKSVFDTIVEGAWRNGEPGIIFLDRLNRDNVVPSQGEIESTNPCGEQPLLPYEACNLGSINLSLVVKEDADGKKVIDYDKLEKTITTAVRFLDDVIEVNKYPLDKIDFTTRQTRKIGLGVMGFADMLLMLGVPYNSDEGVEIGEQIMAFVNNTGHRVSEELATERGAFPLFEESTYSTGKPLRNGTVTTIAPTGTISIIGNCSSGVEPIFAFVYIRNVMDGTELIEVNPILKSLLEERGLYSDELMAKIAEAGTIAHIMEIPQDIRDVFVCAHDIEPEYHCKMQAAFQKNTDNAVSKTVNFPEEATQDDVREVYFMAYETGCKGVTIYRDKSREGQVLNIGGVNETEQQDEAPRVVMPRKRPEITAGLTERMKIGCGNLYVTVNYDENGICEVFTSTGKAGGCPSQSEATARLASISLRSGVAVEEIINQLKGIRCPSTIRKSGMNCTSCPDAMAKVIKKVASYIEDEKLKNISEYAKEETTLKEKNNDIKMKKLNLSKAPAPETNDFKVCPECGEPVEHEGGCVTCRNCGYSKCG